VKRPASKLGGCACAAICRGWICRGGVLLLWIILAISSPAQPFCGPPHITNQPTSLILLAGQTAVFNVGVFDEGCPLTYAWRDFSINILGATNPALSLYNVSSNKVGIYSVVVSDSSGMTPSSNATLTVVTGPRPDNALVNYGSNVTFRVSVDGFGPAAYQWQFNGQTLLGATNSILNLTNVQPFQADAYAVTVRNPAGAVTTSNAMLTVAVLPAQLSGVSFGADGLRFEVTGPGYATYLIQATHDWREWRTISTNTAPASGSFEVIDPDAALFNRRCYRVLQP